MLRNLGAVGASLSRGSAGTEATHSVGDPVQRLAMLDALEDAEISWFWATDADNKVTYLSGSAARKFPLESAIVGEQLGRLVETVLSNEAEERMERPLSFLLSARNRFTDLT